jgi:hypothetical protein
MTEILGEESFKRLQRENKFHITNGPLILSIAKDMKNDPNSWNGFGFLNSTNTESWGRLLHKMLYLQPGWEATHTAFVEFVKALSSNWERSIPTILRSLSEHEVDIEKFFKLERTATFKLAALVHDVNILQKEILNNPNSDVSPFIAKLSHAFLPSVVYQLEEYGLPRMISKKIHAAKAINFFEEGLTIHKAIEIFNSIGLTNLRASIPNLDRFDVWVLQYFYEGITHLSKQSKN